MRDAVVARVHIPVVVVVDNLQTAGGTIREEDRLVRKRF
jgi:hypothetical protein